MWPVQNQKVEMCRGLKGPKKIFRKIETTWQVKLSQQKDAALQGLAGTLASIQKKVHPIVQKIREVSTLSFGQEAAFSSYKYMEEDPEVYAGLCFGSTSQVFTFHLGIENRVRADLRTEQIGQKSRLERRTR